ncbi:GNAT family N-acetyltransferase [Perspicuibacillus lycopersici]|uniref:GNAT family N-acetyltransferase n=1 Tax=Perspicuibacillus lycopersici TaxID=1325689 RepID=UPI0038998F98
MEIRNFQQADMPMLGAFYQAVTSNRKVVFWWIGPEENWGNVFCAYEDGQMVAKGQVEVINEMKDGQSPTSKHSIYLNLKTLPERETDSTLLRAVYEKLYSRALEIKQNLSPTHQTNFCVGNFATEVHNNDFFTKELGFLPLNTLYTMRRDLQQPIIQVQLPASNMQGSFWKMASTEEEEEYLAVEDEIWPEATLGLRRLHEYKANEWWSAITVRMNDELIGSAMAWKEEEIGIIEDVFVRSNWRKRGIATYLLTTALIYLKERGLTTAQLMVDTVNETALRLYQSVGFEVVEKERRYYIDL